MSEPIGTLLHATVGIDRMPLAEEPPVDAARAAGLTLKAYLEQAVFCIPGSPPVRFKLEAVRAEWPEDFTELRYPAAGMTYPTVERGAHALTPTMLEESFGQFGRNTVLWKTAELSIRIQLDFWCSNKPERVAIAAALPALFSPTEDRVGIIVAAGPGYYDREVRFTLLEAERVDTADTVERRDRQLRTLILADIDEVHLRRVVPLQPVIRLAEP